MRVFKDGEGREWQLALTIAAVKRVRDLVGIDLLAPHNGDPPLILQLHGDPVLLIDAVYAAVRPQAEAKGVSDTQFGEAIAGQGTLAIREALDAELLDFFQQSGRADLAGLAKLHLEQVAEVTRQGAKLMAQRAAAIAAEVQAQTAVHAGPIGGNGKTCIGSPESSAATPPA